MADLVVQNSSGSDVTTSLIVAEVFGKNHKDVLRDIEKLSCSENFRVRNFAHTPYTHPQNGQIYHYYEMTKDGFSFLVMGYTGSKAGEFKERFINEFNRRESLLKDDDYILIRSQQILRKRLETSEEKIKQLEWQNSNLRPKAELADKIIATPDKVDVGQVAKILNLGYGRTTLFKKLRETGIFFKNRNEPKQQYIDNGCFELKEHLIERKNHPDFTVVKVIVTQKGIALINKILGGTTSDGKLARIA